MCFGLNIKLNLNVNHAECKLFYWSAQRECKPQNWAKTCCRISSTESKPSKPRSLQAWWSSASERDSTPSAWIILSSFLILKKRDNSMFCFRHFFTRVFLQRNSIQSSKILQRSLLLYKKERKKRGKDIKVVSFLIFRRAFLDEELALMENLPELQDKKGSFFPFCSGAAE